MPAVRFWPHDASPAMASTPISCLPVIDGLRARGWRAALDAPRRAPLPLPPPPPPTLVLARRYDAASVAGAAALRRNHVTRLVLDVCDIHDRIAAAPAAPHAERPSTLTVASNDHAVWRAGRRRWRFPGLYLPWSAAGFGRLLASPGVTALIALAQNAFTRRTPAAIAARRDRLLTAKELP